MSRKSIYYIFLVSVCIITALSSCAPAAAPTAAPAAAPTAAKPAEATPTIAAEKAAPQPAEKVSLTFWTWFQGDHYEDNLKALIKSFQDKYPNVEVKYEALTWQEGDQKISVALASGDPPDVMFQYFSPNYIDTGYILPLDDVMTAEEKADFGDASIQAYTWKGKIYGFPVWKQLWNVGANKALLEEAGIDWKAIQDKGWTFDEFVQTAKKLNKPKSKYSANPQWGFVWQGTYENGGLPEQWQLWNANAGLPAQFDATGKWLWNDQRALDNLKRIISYAKPDPEGVGIAPPETPAFGRGEKAIEMFNNWEAAMYTRSGPYIVPSQRVRCENIKSGKEQGNCIDPLMLPFPHLEGQPEVTVGAIPAHVVFTHKNKKSDLHYKMEIEFARWLSSAEGDCRWAADLYEAPARKSAIDYCDSKGLLLKSDPNQVFFSNYFDRAPYPRIDLDPKLSDLVGKFQQEVLYPNYQAALLGTMSPEEAFTKMVEGAKKLESWQTSQ